MTGGYQKVEKIRNYWMRVMSYDKEVNWMQLKFDFYPLVHNTQPPFTAEVSIMIY